MQPDLTSSERVYWAGIPNPRVIFHSDDWYAIPFSLLWGGFAIFWEGSVLGYWDHPQNGSSAGAFSLFMIVWGIPFVVIGQYLIWGRFLYDAWLKRRTYYVVTDRRVLILQEGWTHRKISATYLQEIPNIEGEGTATGTLWFGPKYPVIAGPRAEEAWLEPLQCWQCADICGSRRHRFSVSLDRRTTRASEEADHRRVANVVIPRTMTGSR